MLRHTRCAAFLCAAVLFAFSAWADRVTPSDRVETRLRVRAAPNANSAVLTSLRPGESLPLAGSVPNFHVVTLTDGRQGFVSKAFSHVIVEGAAPAGGGAPVAPASGGFAVGGQTLRVFFGNLHSHTSFSDGRGTPQVAYPHARDVAGLDFLAITEHNHRVNVGPLGSNHALYNGPAATSLIRSAQQFNEDGRFVAIFGQEFSTIGSGNHANVFEVLDVIDDTQVPSGEWGTLLNTWIPSHLDATGQPALMLLNHPAISDSPSAREYGRDDFNNLAAWRAALDARAELINIINGPSHDSAAPGQPSESEFRRYLDLGFHLGPTADQDNHRLNWGSAAETRTAVIAPSLSKAAIMTALRARQVYASEDRNLMVVPTIGGALIGTRVTGAAVPAVGSALPIVVNLRDADEPNALYRIEVLADQIGGTDDANVVLPPVTRQGDGALTIAGMTYDGGDQYVFLRITQTTPEDDDFEEGDHVWTAPVWFEPGAVPDPAPVAGPAVTLAVDRVAETARLENVGPTPVDLSGWRLVSVQGDQSFRFPAGTSLPSAGVLTVVSGDRASNPQAGELAWLPVANIWRNAGDPGELRNAQDVVVSRAP